MKLRNKKTGEIVDLSVGYIRDVHNGEFIQIKPVACLEDKGSYLYDTFAKFSEDWEDYKPAEPHIKDKKVRRFVRDWAEINGIKKVLVCESFHSWGFKNKNDCKPSDKEYMGADLLFRGEKPEELEFGKEYSITELCGEEKE